jgi:predicted aspartyl protease
MTLRISTPNADRIDAMTRTPSIIALLLLLTACDMSANPFASANGATAEYRPQEAGTVDHALCLLGFVHVPVRNVRPGHQLVEATINGVSGDFVLDTGANVTVVSAGQADRFKLATGAGSILGSGPTRFVGSSGTARQVGVDSFVVGQVAVRQRRVVIAELDQLLGPLGQAAGREVSGIVGQDVLGEHRAIIDVSRPMLYIMKDDREPAPVEADRCVAAQSGPVNPR